MMNKHYVVLPDHSGFKVVCLAHSVSQNLRRIEADALANALNLESCHQQDGFGAVEHKEAYP